MSRPADPRRTTALTGFALALLLALASVVVARSSAVPEPVDVPHPPPAFPTGPPARTSPVPATPATPPSVRVPAPGADYPVRRLGALRDRSILANGRGSADLRYRRAPGNGTRLHFICTGCDADTWLVERPRGVPVGGGPLTSPADATWALDAVDPGAATDLLVRAPAAARWTVTLTPFDAIPVHEQTFDALDDDVVAVRAVGDLRLTCGGAVVVRTLARAAGAAEYAVLQVRADDDAGTWPVTAPTGTDLLVLMVSCRGRWTLTLP